MLGWVVVLLAGFEFKHFVADYLLQPGWMIAGKGDLRLAGGYAHAGIHVLGSALVLLLVRPPLGIALGLLASEFVIHYALDFGKTRYARGIDPDEDAARFWAFHGLDQLFHQFTYVAMTGITLFTLGMS